MDKEMKAKIDEILKANSRRELSMDEMDKVSGGACYDVKDFKTEEDINYYVYTFIKAPQFNCHSPHPPSSTMSTAPCTAGWLCRRLAGCSPCRIPPP